MARLLRAGARYLRSATFYIGLLAVLLGGTWVGTLENPDPNCHLISAAAVVVVMTLQVGREYSDGGFRNKLIAGHGKAAIFWSEWLLAFAVLAVYLIAYCGGFLLTGAAAYNETPTAVLLLCAAAVGVCILCIAFFFSVLTAFCGYLALIERETLPPETAEKLAHIDERVEALQTLAEELLQYAAAASAAPLSLQPVNLSGVLEEELLAFRYALESRGIEPNITMPEKAVWCSLDRNAAVRVAENLLSNAVKYSGGDLTVRLTSAGELTLENAAQLTQSEVQRLFERFYTVDACARSTGLGLSVAKLLTEKMGGAVSAACENGRLILRVKFLPVKE